MNQSFMNIALLILIFFQLGFGQDKTGLLKGRVMHAGTKEPLAGVNIIIEKTKFGTSSDENGYYSLPQIPAGIYNISFHYIGFDTRIITDFVIKPGKTTFCDVDLNERIIEGEEIIVTAGYFAREQQQPVSIFSLNHEEIRRAPGSAGDISRILNSLPSTAHISDNANDLMVRGGSPAENGFIIDNIVVPNINHFPVQGASGGAIGMLNVEFIDDVQFHAGGFSAEYGDKLSSVININFRDGNRENFEGQLDMSMSGFGAVAEGPLPGKKGSWFISARKSYLDMIVDAIGTGVAPRYSDSHAKLTYNLDKRNSISILNLYGQSTISIPKTQALKDANPSYGNNLAEQNTIGLNWNSIWTNNGFSNTSLSYSFIRSDDLWYDPETDDIDQGNNYRESALRLRNKNYYRINRQNNIEFGLDASYEFANYDYFFDSYVNRTGSQIAALNVNDNFTSSKAGLFFNYSWQTSAKLTTTYGVRGDYYTFGNRFHISPRLTAVYQLNNRLSINAAIGIYYQQLPVFLLSQSEENKNLNDPKATHYVLGVDYLLTPDTRLTVEIYNKKYETLPLEPSDPALCVLDDGGSFRYFRRYENLKSSGKAYSSGIEVLIQKKLAENFYGLVSATYFRSRYQDYNGTWRNRIYDNQYIFTVSGGYRLNKRWEFSARWNWAGGIPYTPFDSNLSEQISSGVIDQTRINNARQPDYHSLNLRMDKRWFLNNSDIVSYLSIWNAYNRENVAQYYWDEVKNKQETLYQWSFIPMIGFEYEF